MIIFAARISGRTDGIAQNGPPSESDVQRLNPQRRKNILKVTGWKDLAPGSLNLEVDNTYIDRLLGCNKAYFEAPEGIKYPDEYRDIPIRRGGYLYYWAKLKKGEKVANVLIRRAACVPLKNRLEAFSEYKLRDFLSLSNDDSVICEVE